MIGVNLLTRPEAIDKDGDTITLTNPNEHVASYEDLDPGSAIADFAADWQPPSRPGYESGGPLAGFSEPAAFIGEHLTPIPNTPGVHVVWNADGELIYCGYTKAQRDRLKMHLSGDREASILHKKIGEQLDEAGATASASDIRAELGIYQFAWKADDHPEGLKRRIMEELSPSLNEVAPKVTARPWLFQANPRVFDFLADLESAQAGDEDTWTVSRYEAEMSPGDQVLLWLAGPDAGIYAMGEIIGEPITRSEGGYTRAGAAGDERAIPFRYTRILSQPILKDTLLDHPVLKDLAVIRAPQGTNFKVSEDEWNAVTQLLDSAPIPQRKVWWVNQGSTFAQESAGGYLWAPVETKAGRPASHHIDLRKARPGDVVIAYANTAIRALVAVSASAIDAEKPDELGSEWSRDGMLLKGAYYRLEHPIGITEIPERLRGPEVGPFNRDGRVNQGYFYAVAPSAADELRQRFAERWPADSPWGQEAAISQMERPEVPTHLDYGMAALVRDTLWEESELIEVIDALQRDKGGQVILAGPPGTGKTWVAEHIARYLVAADGTTTTVQFHPSYGYEEFIEGLRPTVGEDNILSFHVQPGVVRRAAAAMDDSDAAHVIVIDEMNRANLPRVFGELMYLFEYRDHPIDLQYTTEFALPERLWFIGTMNTADRSIRSLDIALRRRFDVFECPPRRDILERFYANGAHTNGIPGLYDGFEALNAMLTAELDRHHTVGHTFFMDRHLTRGRLEQTWRRKIGPLIEEYFFDRPDLAAQFSIDMFWPAS